MYALVPADPEEIVGAHFCFLAGMQPHNPTLLVIVFRDMGFALNWSSTRMLEMHVHTSTQPFTQPVGSAS